MGSGYSSENAAKSEGSRKQNQLQDYVKQVEKDEEEYEKRHIRKSANLSADAEDNPVPFTAADTDPTKLRNQFMKAHSVVDEIDTAALLINPSEWEYPFENIVLEGGGNKGLAYVGAIKCFEELGMLGQIKRYGGASAGAITATLAALGYTSDEILAFLSDNIEDVFMDHRCGYLSLLPNVLRNYGWNPGHKIYEWFGNAIEKKMGDPDATFNDLYKSRGVEICIVVTNVNLLSGQYCHPKTTPDMPLRDALRMTMAIPGVFSALQYQFHGNSDLFVDGGVLNNYPINCYDGWYLSMKKEHAFLVKLRNLSEAPEIMSNDNRFKPIEPNKTIGFLLYEETEREVMKFRLEKRIGALTPKRPTKDTPLWLEKKKKWDEMDRAQKSHYRILRAVDVFLAVLHKHNIEDQEFISKDELNSALHDPQFDENSKYILFGQDSTIEKAFKALDHDGNGEIVFSELLKFIEERGVRMQVQFQGFGRREIANLGSFLGALQDALLINLKYTAVTTKDEERTVGINTGHLGTLNYDLQKEDRDFAVARGYNSTMSFLRYFAASNPTLVKPRQEPVHSQQPTSIKSN